MASGKLDKVRCSLVGQLTDKKVWGNTGKISPLVVQSSCDEQGIREFDVVCGKKANSNPGNEKFRLMIHRNRQAYQSTSARDVKQKIIESIIEQVQVSGGRFLKVEGDIVLMEELTYESCYEKVSHALRAARAPVANIVRSKEELNDDFGSLLEVQKKLFQEYLDAEGLDLHDEVPTRRKVVPTRSCDPMDIVPEPYDKYNHNELDLDQETLGFLLSLR